MFGRLARHKHEVGGVECDLSEGEHAQLHLKHHVESLDHVEGKQASIFQA